MTSAAGCSPGIVLDWPVSHHSFAGSDIGHQGSPGPWSGSHLSPLLANPRDSNRPEPIKFYLH